MKEKETNEDGSKINRGQNEMEICKVNYRMKGLNPTLTNCAIVSDCSIFLRTNASQSALEIVKISL